MTEPTTDPTDAPGIVPTNPLPDAVPELPDPLAAAAAGALVTEVAASDPATIAEGGALADEAALADPPPVASLAPEAQATEAQTTGAQTTGAQTTGAQTTGAQTTGAQTTEAQATEAQATGAQAADTQADEYCEVGVENTDPPRVDPPLVEPERPIFADLGLSESILRAVEEMGYRHPTPIQAQAIPVVLAGRDVMGVAQTGTGKTAGFTLPMLDILTGSRARARMPRSLILEPTRELALQVAENFIQYGKYLKLTHALIIGGESMSDQKDILMKGVDVLIATPGRLIDMFDRGSILLSDARLLVIDEADRMLDMGFIPDVERIVSLLPANRQTLFFSATMGPEIRRLADAFLREPKEITVSRPASVATTITEGLVLVAELDKREALRHLIRKHNVQNALIFCNRKVDVDILYKSLNRHRFSVGALHGDMAQSVRFQTLEKFKAGDLQLLVCSDVAARGIDIGGLSHVFNFDVPHHAEDYVHRIGRTGRAGLEGHAFTIAKPDDRFAIEAIEKLINHPIPPVAVEGLDPVDWAEGDGRRRRGRGAKKAAPVKKSADTKKAARPERAPRDRPRRMQGDGGEESGLPVNADAPEIDATAVDVEAQDEPRQEAPRRTDGRRDEPRRDEARRDGPRRDAGRRDDAPRDEARRDEARRDEARRDEARRGESRRDESRRDQPRRDEPRRDDPRRVDASRGDARRDEPRRDEWRREPPRRERFRRDDDLGPPVLGFGDDVPAFMSLRARTPRPIETTDTDA